MRCVEITIKKNVFVVLIDLFETKWRILNMMPQMFTWVFGYIE
jgi:hypothetical protein